MRCRCGANITLMTRAVGPAAPWFFRPERMYLIPGDSPMGYRLPLDSIPWVNESEYPYLYEQDPMEDRGAAAGPRGAVADSCESREAWSRGARWDSWSRCWKAVMAASVASGAAITRGSPICRRRRANPRLGLFAPRFAPRFAAASLRVFMPPQRYLEDYLELVAAVEDTAASLGIPVLLEGYTPPQTRA